MAEKHHLRCLDATEVNDFQCIMRVREYIVWKYKRGSYYGCSTHKRN